MSMSQRNWKRVQYEKGYPWLFFYAGRAWGIGLLVTIIVVGVAGAFSIWYWQSGNVAAPASIAGYGYAIAGTLCFLLAATLYTARRRSNKRTMGQLNTALNWHVFFAIMGTVFVFMHSFGNFYAKTGTYALYGLVALLVSGFVGRILDHLVPRLIAGEVDTILTTQGEDKMMELHLVKGAIRREQFYRYVIRYWRLLHLVLALLVVGLIIWHLVYVAQLLIPTIFHRT